MTRAQLRQRKRADRDLRRTRHAAGRCSNCPNHSGRFWRCLPCRQLQAARYAASKAVSP